VIWGRLRWLAPYVRILLRDGVRDERQIRTGPGRGSGERRLSLAISGGLVKVPRFSADWPDRHGGRRQTPNRIRNRLKKFPFRIT